MSILDGWTYLGWTYLRLIYMLRSEAITVMTILGIEPSCAASLGLGNTTRTDLLEGGAWGARKTVTFVVTL